MTDTARRFVLRQKITMMVNRYELRELGPDGAEGPLLALAEQKRLAFKEQVTFFADEARTQPVFGFKARQRMDLGAVYDVTDANGTAIGEFRKDFKASLLRSTWHLSSADGTASIGQERNMLIAVVRRFSDIPFLPFHFDFVTSDGQVALTSQRQRSLRDSYELTVPTQADGRQLDWRVAAAMGVALDALLAR